MYEIKFLHKESRVIKDNYSSHNGDIIIILDDFYITIECKYSSYSIQKKHIDQIKGFKNKFKNFIVYLLSYDYYDAVIDKLNIITNNNIDEILELIEIISIEDLISDNPLKLK